MLDELELNVDDTCRFDVVVEEDTHGFGFLLFGGLKNRVEIHHTKANQGIRGLIGIPQLQLEMPAILLETTVDEEIKGLIENRLLTAFRYNLTGGGLI